MTNITANYDQTWKEAIGQYFESFLQFFYPKIYEDVLKVGGYCKKAHKVYAGICR
jgi:hypothetical protein